MVEADGGMLRKGMSVRMKKNIIACQPFKDGVSTIICSGCHALMAYPAGSEKVKCTACGTVTTGIKVPCTACKQPLRLPIKLDDATCTKCGYRFQPISTFRLALPEGKEITKLDAQVMDAAVEAPPKLITLQLQPHASLEVEFDGVNVKAHVNRSLRSNFTGWCSKLDLNKNMSFIIHDSSGQCLDSSKTPEDLNLSQNDVLTLSKEREEGVTSSHDFVYHQFMKPTNCGFCHKFIWGMYKQGQWCTKCRLPVHHRCAKKVTKVCEVALREACGLSLDDYGDEDGGGGDVPEGFPIDELDMNEWEEYQKPTTTYRNDSFMSSFGKLSDWTDEEIAEVWKRYDDDQNGSMDREELEQFIGDLIGAEGGRFSDEEMRAEVDRVLKRMDTNNNGIIEWEEFWYFHQAQRATDFLNKFQGLKITEKAARELWDHYDEDGSGTLDTDEIRALLRDCASTGGAKITDLEGGDSCGFWELGELVTWEKFKEVFLPIISESLYFDV